MLFVCTNALCRDYPPPPEYRGRPASPPRYADYPPRSAGTQSPRYRYATPPSLSDAVTDVYTPGAARKVLCLVLDLVLAMTRMLLVLVGHLTTATLVAMRVMDTLAQRPCGAVPHQGTILHHAPGMPTSGTEDPDRPVVFT